MLFTNSKLGGEGGETVVGELYPDAFQQHSNYTTQALKSGLMGDAIHCPWKIKLHSLVSKNS